MVSFSVDNVSLEKVISLLQNQSQLDFKKITDRQVIVSARDTTIEICGYLFDETTNVPLPYASISLKNTNKGTIANEDGFFQLGFLEPNEQIKIEFVGYRDKIMSPVDFKKKRCPRIPLFIRSTTLETVLIVEYLTKGVGKNIDGSLGINNEVLGILPGQTEADVLQGIQMIPGISSSDETASGIQIRGGSADQNLVLWDNIRMYNTGHLFGMISAFNPNVISDTKIIKSGANPAYGDRLSGVIDISSDAEIPKKLNGGAGINGTHADLFFKTPIGNKVGLIISGRRAYTDYLRTPTYEALFEKVFQNTKIVETATNPNPDPGEEDEEDIEEDIRDNNFFFYDTSIKLIANITENDKIMVSGIYTNNDLNFEIADEEDILTDDLTITNEGVSVSWQGTKANQWQHSLKGYYSKYDSDYRFTLREEIEIEEQSIRKNTVKELGIDANLRYDFNKRHALSFGYQFTNNKVFYAITRESDFEDLINETDIIKNKSNTVYSNYIFSSKNKGFVNLGIRGSHYAIVNQFYIEPRVNVAYPITKFLRIKGTAELRYQPISQLVEFEDTQLRLGNNLWIHSDNEQIPVLQSTQFSGGALFSNHGWNLELDGSYKKIEGLTSLTNGFNNVNTDFSTGFSEIVGIDLLVKKQFNHFRTWVGYTFNDVTYTFAEIQEDAFPGNNDIRHNFRISNTLEIDQWEFSLGWLWRSGAPFTDANLVNEDIIFGNPNSQRLPDYHRLDASVLYDFKLGQKNDVRVQLGLSMLNIYNRQVPLSISYVADENQNTEELELDALRQQSLGFTPNLTFRIWF